MKIRLNNIELTLPTGQRLTELLAVQEIAPQGVAVASTAPCCPAAAGQTPASMTGTDPPFHCHRRRLRC